MGFWNRKKEIPAADPNVAKKLDDEMKQKAWEAKLAIAGAENANRTVVNFAPPSIQATLTGTVDPTQLKAPKEEEDVKPKEKEWIWVEGYKAVNPDMSAKWGEMTYEVGELYEIEGDVGYHFCLKPEFIREYYKFGRLFKVRAEVEKDEYEKMKENGFYKYKYKDWHPYSMSSYGDRVVDKMVARKIELVEEITDYEIIRGVWDNNPLFVRNETDWWEFINFCKKAKSNSREDAWAQHMFIKKMMENGFSETIALVFF